MPPPRPSDNDVGKVHRHYLSPSGERTLFTSLLDAAPPEYGQQFIPSILLDWNGDSIDDFRAFCGYANSRCMFSLLGCLDIRFSSSFSPLDLRPDAIPDRDLMKLIRTVRFTRNYGLTSFRLWGAANVRDVISRNDEKVLVACPIETYVAVLNLYKPVSGPFSLLAHCVGMAGSVGSRGVPTPPGTRCRRRSWVTLLSGHGVLRSARGN